MAGLDGAPRRDDAHCSPAAGSSGWRSAARSCTSRRFCFWTSRPPASTRSRARAFWDLIHELSEAGHTIFVSTHYMDEAEYCHRLALMYRGRVIALGTPAELKAGLTAHSLLNLDIVGPARDHARARRAGRACTMSRCSAADCTSRWTMRMRPARGCASALAAQGIEVRTPGADSSRRWKTCSWP